MIAAFRPVETFLNFFFSIIGFRDSLIDNDSTILPCIKEALQETPYAGLEIGGKAPGRYYEHAVRFLGENHVVKYVEPAPAEVMKNWLDRLHKQKAILERYHPHNLPAFSYFYIPVGTKATYALVMEKIEGRPLSQLSDGALFSNPELVENLVEFLEGNREMRKTHGIFADLIGGPARKILNPRYTGNLYVTNESQVKLVDTVLIPNFYNSQTVPSKYRLAKLYHFCYRTFVLPQEQKFFKKLKKI